MQTIAWRLFVLQFGNCKHFGIIMGFYLRQYSRRPAAMTRCPPKYTSTVPIE